MMPLKTSPSFNGLRGVLSWKMMSGLYIEQVRVSERSKVNSDVSGLFVGQIPVWPPDRLRPFGFFRSKRHGVFSAEQLELFLFQMFISRRRIVGEFLDGY
ncbi:hypothetical protein ES703_89728 [subsurface metagenome]